MYKHRNWYHHYLHFSGVFFFNSLENSCICWSWKAIFLVLLCGPKIVVRSWGTFNISQSSSSWRAASTDVLDPLSPRLPIIHRLRQVFGVTSRIITELLYECSSWSSCFWLAICGGPQEHITYDLVFDSPAVSGMSGSSSLYSFRDRW